METVVEPMKLLNSVLLLLFCCKLLADDSAGVVVQIPEVHLPQGSFWEKNPKVRRRVSEDRDIIVLVKAQKSERKNYKHKLLMQGIGLVNTPVHEAFRIAKNFNNLKKVSDHIIESKYTEENGQLFMHSEAFGYHAKMHMNTQVSEGEQKKSIRFQIYEGVFSGMVGVIRFVEQGSGKSEIQLLCEYHYEKLAIPKLFVEFGLEVVIQKIAAKMRTFLESQDKEVVVERTGA